MAGDTETRSDGLPGGPVQSDFATHRAGYDRFMKWFKLGTIVSVIVAGVAVVLIAS